MKIVFMGTPEFAVPTLEALNEKYDVVLVVSQPDRAKKKNQIIMTPVHECAERLGLNIIQPESIKDSFEAIKEVEADVLVSAAYGQYIPSKILNLFKYTLIHSFIHTSWNSKSPRLCTTRRPPNTDGD